jgi:prepilin-type N-terminal cleavage/methylation domain-containing protein
MAKPGSKNVTRRSLTLLEVLIVMALIGVLSLGGLVLGKKALNSAFLKNDGMRLKNKLALAKTMAQAWEQPVALSLKVQNGRCNGVIECRGMSTRPFVLHFERILVGGKDQRFLRFKLDEFGESEELKAAPITLMVGDESFVL